MVPTSGHYASDTFFWRGSLDLMTYPIRPYVDVILMSIAVAGCAAAGKTPSEPAIATTEVAAVSLPVTSEPSENMSPPAQPSTKTALDLRDVVQNPKQYSWFNFKPNLEKLILAGAPETEHIALLWYTVPDGKVGLHYHSKTESVYVVSGTQTDAKGVYPTGTVYFNPPGSGHQIKDSTGFFILAYASPPDFKSTEAIGEYEPVKIDTNAKDFLGAHAFVDAVPGVKTFVVPLEATGGMTSTFAALEGAGASFAYDGNYVLVLRGKCNVDGQVLAEQSLVVTKAIETERFLLASEGSDSCLAMGISFGRTAATP
jgi:hypothetical protein